MGTVLALAATSTTFACGGSIPLPKTFDDAILPGAIVESFKEPPKIEIVCRQGDSVGTVKLVDPSAAPPPTVGPNDVIVSVTKEPDFTSASTTDDQVSLDAGVSTVLSALKAQGKHVSKINYSATNVKGYTTSLTDERKGRANRNPACTAQIADEQKSKLLELVTKAYVGDVTYTVEFDNNVSADVKIQITKDIAPSLGGSVDTTNSSKIVGQHVTWLAQSTPYGKRSGD